MSYSAGAIEKAVKIPITGVSTFGICPLNSKFLVAAGKTGDKIVSFAVDKDLAITYQFEEVSGTWKGSECSPITGKDEYYLSNIS
eukprot:CAMPEP_0115020292 /NCGR_PEP_ID=MMETSP0216-20121206/30004_1 /TAXON_ID=223996 /ORGANISM="Protocruzia adherens, Strain Boccale" /LENGTH=84 /DNA_ID=CAMNT_0002392029 /DNA_START=30 /DNA_END=280 /DNA_ORIENTATION=+